MNRLLRRSVVALLVPVVAATCSAWHRPAVMGAYRLEDGRLLSIRKSVGNTLRCRFYASGDSRRLHPDGTLRYVAGPGFSDKSPVEITVRFRLDERGRASGLSWTRSGGPSLSGERIVREQELTFDSSETTLAGRLSLPEGRGPHPAVVLVHGSGADAATGYFYSADFFAAHGIAALTYDKRGTGLSTGTFTFDFHQLASDVVAAVEYLQTRPEVDGRRIGLAGYSQAGWVAPLAASLSDDVRFVIVSYGLIDSPAEEARVETRNTVRKRGVDEAALDHVDELTLAAVKIVASDFEQGWEEFDRLKRQYRREPWIKQLSGTVVGKFVSYPRWLVRWLGPRRAPRGLLWYYDSSAVLESLDVPMVWLLAERDESAPIELALPALRRLQAAGKPYEAIVFPDADHSMLVFTEESGERSYTGYAPGYFEAEVRAARRLSGME